MDRDWLLTAFRLQAGGCRYFGSELYGGLMDAALADVRSGGPVARLLEGWEGDPVRGFLPLRLFGAVHERVLSGNAPELAAYYPSAGGRADAVAAWPAFRDVVEAQAELLAPRLANFPQTNEVRRCAGLLGGFLFAFEHTGLPLRLREVGCSAGLNLNWHRYQYQLGSHRWGPPDSPVRIHTDWKGPPAAFALRPRVESRAGCDLDPRRIERDDELRILESFVWPDQPGRFEQLRAAVQIWREDPPRVDRALASEWLARELDEASEGSCLVVFHSSVWIYLSAEEQGRWRTLLEARGSRATEQTPLVWLRHEDDPSQLGQIEVRIQLWPAGQEHVLGRGHPHGRFVEWLESA